MMKRGACLLRRGLKSLVLGSVVTVVTMAAAAEPCDQFTGQNDQARKARVAGKLDEAQRLVQAILAKDPTNFRANYTNGLILIERSGLDKPGPLSKTLNRKLFVAGMHALESAAKLLDGPKAACAETNGWYGIYNTIGADYFNAEDLDRAAQYLEIAASHWNALDPTTKQRLLSTLQLVGTAYYKISKYDSAVRIYSLIAKIGDAKAAAVAIATVKNAQRLKR